MQMNRTPGWAHLPMDRTREMFTARLYVGGKFYSRDASITGPEILASRKTRTTATTPSVRSDLEETTHVISPKNSKIEGCTLILLKELKIYIKHIARFECTHHPQENVQVSGPFSNDRRYGSSAQLSSELLLSGCRVGTL